MDILAQLTQYVEAITGMPENSVIVGRENWERLNFTNDIATVDILGADVIKSRTRSYDDVNEVMTYTTYKEGLYTVAFMGDNAEANANIFVGLQVSQQAKDLQCIGLFQVNCAQSITAIKPQNGEKFRQRFEVELNVKSFNSYDVDTLRIDSVNIETVLFDK